MKKIIFTVSLLAIAMLSYAGGQVLAYQIQDLPDTIVEGDVVLGPTKIELFLNPGETTTQEIMVTNRTGKDLTFKIEMEDFKGSRDPNQSVIFMGTETGPYSLKDWLTPELREFTLKHGQRIYLPVQISIPIGTEPGGHYGVVFAAAQPSEEAIEAEADKTKGQVSVVFRAGPLFFIRISGDVSENGYLKEFKTGGNYYERGPIPFQLEFENNGSIHLTPYGTIEIFNVLGKEVGKVEVDPYFAMPDSLKARELIWEKDLLFGRYKAVASINRGYKDIIDEKSVIFWVIPWKLVLEGFIGIFILILFFRWIFSHFEIKKKSTIGP
jgi:hypothetical protein